MEDRLIDLEPEWVHLNTDENGVKMNAYFVDHPEMVLGEWKTVSGRFGEEDTVIPYENADLTLPSFFGRSHFQYPRRDHGL